jgi:hypothetical protein
MYDRAGIGDDGMGERSRLRAAVLVRLIEDFTNLRIALEHQRIEDAGDALGVLSDYGGSGLDDGDLVWREH